MSGSDRNGIDLGRDLGAGLGANLDVPRSDRKVPAVETVGPRFSGDEQFDRSGRTR